MDRTRSTPNRAKAWIFGCVSAAALAGTNPGIAESVSFSFEREFELQETKIPYTMSVALNSVSSVRIGMDAVLGLQQAQQMIPTLLTGDVLVDVCNTKIEIGAFSVDAAEDAIGVSGTLQAEFYACEREKLSPVDRGELLFSQSLAMAATASVTIRDQCVHFRFDSLELHQDGPLGLTADQQEFLVQAKTLVLEVSDRILMKFPICPELPTSLASLDPDFQAGGTREIGDGGLGVYLQGSINVSTATILDVFQVLQDRKLLPPAP